MLLTVADKDKQEAYEIAKRFDALGFQLFATSGTATFMKEKGLRITEVGKIGSGDRNVLSIINQGEVQFVINTLTSGKQPRSDGFRIRREAVEHGIISLTNLDTAEAILNVIDSTSFHAQAMMDKGAIKA